LSAHSVITREHIELLLRHGIQLSKQDIEGYEEPSTEQKKDHVEEEIHHSVQRITEYFDSIRLTRKVPLADIRENIIPALYETSRSATLYQLFMAMQARDDYTYRHNLAVSMFSNLLGGWLGMDKQELAQLTTAALLHDVGKMLVPDYILNHPGKLTPEQFDEVKKHTVYGYEILKSTTGVTHRQAMVALQHHERLDGSGYPYGLTASKIDLFSRIVSVVDVFHAMTSKRVYRDASPFYEVLLQISKDAYGPLDPRITNLFIRKIMATLTGQQVMLTDGRTGVIVMVPEHDPTRPLVQVDGQYIDLAKELSVHIRQIF
jgi:putative nucleotidyltransferase with HDIG domain